MEDQEHSQQLTMYVVCLIDTYNFIETTKIIQTDNYSIAKDCKNSLNNYLSQIGDRVYADIIDKDVS